MMILRPFPEGNERLGRLLSGIILLRAGYVFFSEVSLSSLIARKSYGYYEAMTNILREENGGDLTYFLEYFMELLARAVDERELQMRQRTEQNLHAERTLARTALPIVPEQPTPPTGGEPLAPAYETQDIQRDAPIDVLSAYARNPERISGQFAAYLLKKLSDGQVIFTAEDAGRCLRVSPQRLSSSIHNLKRKGAICLIEQEGMNVYQICAEARAEPAEMTTELPDDYAPEIIEKLRMLTQSNSSKDKRIGAALLDKLGVGVITAEDYDRQGYELRWATDMNLAEQLGLVESITPTQYRILRELKSGPPVLSDGQRKFITEVYRAFGDESFSKEMLVATLDYTGAHISACLHKFTLLQILDCRKEEDVNRYQFRITPEACPQCFDLVA